MQFVEALREKGFGKDGRRLKSEEGGKDLVGTASFLPEAVMLTLGIKELRGQIDTAVQEMIKRQEGTMDGNNKRAKYLNYKKKQK